jgi:hypothetical protein
MIRKDKDEEWIEEPEERFTSWKRDWSCNSRSDRTLWQTEIRT